MRSGRTGKNITLKTHTHDVHEDAGETFIAAITSISGRRSSHLPTIFMSLASSVMLTMSGVYQKFISQSISDF